MLVRKQIKGRARITFVLPADIPPGPVSVVGDFNDWQPGVHPFEPRSDGMRAVSVVLPGKSVQSFRYLAAGDNWFDEDHADGHDGTNGLLYT